jgi:hypothetical protein
LRVVLASCDRVLPVEDFDEAEALIRREMLNFRFQLEIEATLSSGKQPSRFEAWFYKFLGVSLEAAARRISVRANQGLALVVFEELDREYVPFPVGELEDGSIELTTAAGEPFLASKRDCIPVLDAIELSREFVRTRRRPKAVRWTGSS